MLRVRELNSNDYLIIERYIMNIDALKERLLEVDTDGMRINLKRTIDGIIHAYNALDVKEQQLFKLLWWERETKEVICDVLDISNITIGKFRKRTLNKVADNILYL